MKHLVDKQECFIASKFFQNPTRMEVWLVLQEGSTPERCRMPILWHRRK